MRNVIRLDNGAFDLVDRVSVQVSEYSEKNGGVDRGLPTLYLVEVLFTDGTWATAGHFEDLAEARLAACMEAKNRNAKILKNSLWPSRKVTEGAT